MSQEKIPDENLKFVTKGNFSKDTYKEIANVSIRKNVLIRILAIVYLVLIVVGVWSVVHRLWAYLLIAVGALVLFSVTIIISRNRSINTSMRRIQELYGVDTLEYVTGFTDEAAYSENTKNDIYVSIKYEDIKSLYRSKHFLFLVTEGGQFITVFKDCLSKDEEHELLMFLNEKGVYKKRNH